MTLGLIITIAVIVVLLALSALFSGSETALTAASQPRMHHLQQSGNKRAAQVNALSARKERLIGAILLSNNLVNILASALATSVLIALVGDAGVAYATAIMTVLVVVFAEVLPKTYAIHHADRMALAVAPAIRPVVVILAPAAAVVQALVAAILRVLGVRSDRESHMVSLSDELRGTIDLHTRAGRMVKSDRDMLDSVLALPDIQLDEIMVHRRNMVMIDVDEPGGAIVHDILQSPYTRIPLWRENIDNIIGVLHVRDMLRAITEHDGNYDTLDIAALARPPWFVPESTTLYEQLNAFRRRHEHFSLVVDEYGVLQGLVTLEDILEEIVGEIEDEYDVVGHKPILPQPDGSFTIDGTVSVRDLNRHLDWDLPEEDAATIAGLLIHEARKIPDVGETFSFHDFDFEVVRRYRNQVTSLRIRPPAAPKNAKG